jgi:hypothetical protein
VAFATGPCLERDAGLGERREQRLEFIPQPAVEAFGEGMLHGLAQQLQGEALERELESLLRNRFPQDVLEPVPKVNSAVTFFTAFKVQPPISSAPYCGNANALRLGMMFGWPS